MTVFRKIWKDLPIEVPIYWTLFLVIFLAVWGYSGLPLTTYTRSALGRSGWFFDIWGENLGVVFGLFVLLFCAARGWIALASRVTGKEIVCGVPRYTPSHGMYIILSGIFWWLSLQVAVVTVFSLESLTRRASVPRIVWASELLNKADAVIFQTPVVYWLNQQVSSAFAQQLLLLVYSRLGVICFFSLLIFLVLRPFMLRQFIATLFIVQLISFPIWLALPAISPDELYRQKVLARDVSNPIVIEPTYSFTLSSSLEPYLHYLESIWSIPEIGSYAVTTFPSMHVAWAALVVLYAYRLRYWLGLVYAAWFVLLAVSTVYTLQHFAVDILGGIAVAVLTVFIVDRLYRYEVAHENRSGLNAVLYCIHDDGMAFIDWAGRQWKSIRSVPS